ncbi:MAG: universal stress protein [Proteobacteria bacterium]|nr:universal stress protein [Pseudomonadota bacterium]
MAYKTILLCLNEIDRVPQVIAAGRQLAALGDAHVTGLYVVPAVQVYSSAGLAAMPDVYDGNRKFYLDHLPKVKEAFETAMKDDGIAFAFHQVDAATPMVSSAVIAESHSVDLVVASSTNPDDSMGAEYDFVQRLVMAAGRPVLVLPRKGEAALDLSEIILGWDGGREAARAAFDAIPLMKKAKRVKIARVDEAPRGSLTTATIAEALARHKINVELLNITSDGMNAGETLLRAANDHGAGLLVMGAYGHSRLAEFVFGGATRHAIQNLDRPVLMSH